ncbi:MAG TPA: hypothetical protein VNK23_13020 [Candidatus Dormibacteraeota bacterium]|nr:hypothetical protein [Candidatus Dormibacteraeota bacterium]
MRRDSTCTCLRMIAVIFVCLSIACAQPPARAQSPKEHPLPRVSIPFIGCRAEGQAGPKRAPLGAAKLLPIPEDAAQQLAFYQASVGLGILAPRGWQCLEIYGSSGGALFVSPRPIVLADLYSKTWAGFAGPIVELDGYEGGTSGRYDVATIIARVFPAYRRFAQQVINEGIEPASSFPFGPYQADELTYKSSSVVEYETPAESEGLGTTGRVRKSNSPIKGVAILRGPPASLEFPDLLLLAVRLPPGTTKLSRVIIHHLERHSRLAH